VGNKLDPNFYPSYFSTVEKRILMGLLVGLKSALRGKERAYKFLGG